MAITTTMTALATHHEWYAEKDILLYIYHVDLELPDSVDRMYPIHELP